MTKTLCSSYCLSCDDYMLENEYTGTPEYLEAEDYEWCASERGVDLDTYFTILHGLIYLQTRVPRGEKTCVNFLITEFAQGEYYSPNIRVSLMLAMNSLNSTTFSKRDAQVFEKVKAALMQAIPKYFAAYV